MGAGPLVFLAVLPAIVLIVYVYRQDRIEKEPIGLLFKLLLFGAISVITAVALELAGEALFGLFFDEESIIFAYIDCFIVVAISEEIGKLIALKLGSWKHPAFNFTFDGIVYGVCSSLGFAIVENVMYVAGGGLGTAITRAITAVPGHAIFGVFMGLYYGRAKRCAMLGDIAGRKKNMCLALFVPVLIHGFYDFCLSVESIMAFLTFFILVIAMYVMAFSAIKKASATDAPVIPYAFVLSEPPKEDK